MDKVKMSGLLFLTSNDFNIQKGSKGKNIMCNRIRGFSLILFYSTSCSHCQTLLPKFKMLPGTIGGCQFGIINVSKNKKCINMSRSTVAPIKYVPYIVLYINGRPFMIYKGPYDVNEMKRFVLEVAKSVQKKQQFTHNKENNNQMKKKGKIPDYTTGIPVYGEGKEEVCYLEFSTAYQDEKKYKK